MDPNETPTEGTTVQVVEESLAEGRLEGGWGYIWAAYGITWFGLLAYTVYVVVRRYLQTQARPHRPA
ncbi:MAG: hypothetical protein AB8H79_02180 [Myxococcota bacterium]